MEILAFVVCGLIMFLVFLADIASKQEKQKQLNRLDQENKILEQAVNIIRDRNSK